MAGNRMTSRSKFPPTNDLALMIRRLRYVGFTQRAIAKRVRLTQPTISRVRDGTTMKYRNACRLIALYEKECAT